MKGYVWFIISVGRFSTCVSGASSTWHPTIGIVPQPQQSSEITQSSDRIMLKNILSSPLDIFDVDDRLNPVDRGLIGAPGELGWCPPCPPSQIGEG